MSPVSAAFGIASSNYNTYRGKKDKHLCTFCGFHGHIVEKRYKKHGYPPGCKPKGYNNAESYKGQSTYQSNWKPRAN